MLQRIRDGLHGRKWLAWLALFPIAAIFIFWGGSNSLDLSGVSRQDAAKVDGEEIPAIQATKAWRDTEARWSRQFGTEIPADQRARIQDNILDQLVLQKVLENRLQDEHYRVSEQRVLAEIQNFPAFKGSDGKYDPSLARQLLSSNGISEVEFFNDQRKQLLLNQLQAGIANSYFLTKGEAQRLYNLENEEREVEYVEFKADQFAGDAPIEDAAIQAYYDKNGDRFMTTESVSLDYAELRLEQLASQVAPTEADLRKLYDDNRGNYVLEERRRARHILIPVHGDDDAAARKEAESVLAQARAGKDFAALAKQYSKDSTAADGGELGFVQKKDFPGPFGDTLFAMKVGDIAGPVKSQFGYHLIKLEEIQAGEAKPFEAVQGELDAQYRQEKSAELFGERQDQISAMLEKGETDLDKIAAAAGLTRGSIAEFLRGGGAEPLGSSADLQQVVFDDATLNQGKIGGPVALGEDRLVLVKVTAHHKAEVKPLAQVRDEIVGLLKHERGVAAAKAAAEGLVTKLESGEKLATLASGLKATAEPARFVSRGDPSIPAALRTAVFEAPRPEGKPVVRTASLDDGSSAVFVVTRTRVGDTSANPQLVQQQNMALTQRAAAGDVTAYVNQAKSEAKVVKNPKVFE
ncbi:MAG TPA: peptidyl-prolyl cis-trans isomerase [Steroidobacteraceae bacterium]|jgi:peptidyl-prolyl cis-trans isomerase D|nr:peptidyl-prolyl cis-trans isomerase [Steroidobacteraceae bacterium]